MTQEKKIVPKDEQTIMSIRGVEITIDPQVFDDWKVLELLYLLDPPDDTEAKPFAVVPLVKRILGKQYQYVMNALENKETGRISPEEMTDFVKKIMEGASPNSSRS